MRDMVWHGGDDETMTHGKEKKWEWGEPELEAKVDEQSQLTSRWNKIWWSVSKETKWRQGERGEKKVTSEGLAVHWWCSQVCGLYVLERKQLWNKKWDDDLMLEYGYAMLVENGARWAAPGATTNCLEGNNSFDMEPNNEPHANVGCIT